MDSPPFSPVADLARPGDARSRAADRVLASYRISPHRGQIARQIFLICVTGLFCPILEGVWTNVLPHAYRTSHMVAIFGGGLAVAIISFPAIGFSGGWLRQHPCHVRAMEYTPSLAAVCAAVEIYWIILSISLRKP